MPIFNSASWTGLGNEAEIKLAQAENEEAAKETIKMGGFGISGASSSTWSPGGIQQAGNGTWHTANTVTWTPGAQPAYQQAIHQASITNHLYAQAINQQYPNSIVSGSGYFTYPHTTGVVQQHYQPSPYTSVALPNGVPHGTRYIHTYDANSNSWVMSIEDAPKEILTPAGAAFSRTELEEAEDMIRELENA